MGTGHRPAPRKLTQVEYMGITTYYDGPKQFQPAFEAGLKGMAINNPHREGSIAAADYECKYHQGLRTRNTLIHIGRLNP